jgi:adenylate cyclase
MQDGAHKLQGWFAELRRRKVFRVAAVYAVVAWLAIQVADAVFEPLGLPAWTLKLVIVLALLGFPLACALAWAFDVTPRGIERTPPAPGAVSNQVPVGPQSTVGVVAADRVEGPAALAPAAVAAPAESVAVLPFADLSPARDHAYFCDGIAEEIISALCVVRGLRVASRTSSFQFKDRPTDVREIGRLLNVGAVLEGSVRRAEDRVRITAQLVGTGDGYHLWSESFDRRLEDVFATQAEIAQKLVRALRVSLSREERELIERRGTSSAEAYDYYLRGQHLLHLHGSGTVLEAAALFRRAISHDAAFAQAHAGLANALAIKGQWRLDMTPDDFEEAMAASRRALELEPRLAEAIVSRACVLSMQGRAHEAEQAFEDALRVNPASYEACFFYGRHCVGTGDAVKAARQFEAAVRLEPADYQARCLLVTELDKLGRQEEARSVGMDAMRIIDGRLERDPQDARALQLGAVLAVRLGDPERARELVERSLVTGAGAFSAVYNAACTYALLGDREQALTMLDRAVTHGRGNLGWIEHDSDLDSLRGDPRFEAILDRLRTAAGGRST